LEVIHLQNVFYQELVALAESGAGESDLLDYKREFSPQLKAAFWAEAVKDIVAFANTRGGILVFGVNDDGSLAATDCHDLFTFDLASIGNQIEKYTNFNYSEFSIKTLNFKGEIRPALLISPISIPLVFTSVGSYEVEPGKQKTAFSKGTIYFRHGSKSEPCSRSDLEAVVERRLQLVRNEWLGNIRKVVEAPAGTNVIVTTESQGQERVQITTDPNAPLVRITKLSEQFPFTQKAVIEQVNNALDGKALINTHDIQTIKHCEKIDPESRPELVHKPHEKSSPQYSMAFVKLIIDRILNEEGYLVNCRALWRTKSYPPITITTN
jgi:hypothetical protein